MKTIVFLLALVTSVTALGKTREEAEAYSAKKMKEAMEHSENMQKEKERIIKEARRRDNYEDQKIYEQDILEAGVGDDEKKKNDVNNEHKEIYGLRSLLAKKYTDEDKINRNWPDGKRWSNLVKATSDVDIYDMELTRYIFMCKRHPLNLEDAFKPIKNGPEECRPIKPTVKGLVTPWIDPWGRPYQIRYDKKRQMLQVRSHGRRIDDMSDDVFIESNLGLDEIFYKEIEKCKKLSSDDKDCVFNRGWH